MTLTQELMASAIALVKREALGLNQVVEESPEYERRTVIRYTSPTKLDAKRGDTLTVKNEWHDLQATLYHIRKDKGGSWTYFFRVA